MTSETIESDAEQWTASQHRDGLRLIPPLAEEFTIIGSPGAHQWALERRYLLADGIPGCAHGLYLMPSCPRGSCRTHFRQLDHARVWVPEPDSGSRPFLLFHPYSREIADETRAYARAHGLDLSPGVRNCGPGDYPGDDWYGHDTLPLRLTIPPDWPLWPIEATALILLHTQPVTWPDDQRSPQ